jgi:rhodanese-related sulfurtransferase
LFGKLSGVKQIGPQEAVLLFNHEDALVLDVREQSEWADGHIGKGKTYPARSVEEQAQRTREIQGQADHRGLPQRQSLRQRLRHAEKSRLRKFATTSPAA